MADDDFQDDEVTNAQEDAAPPPGLGLGGFGQALSSPLGGGLGMLAMGPMGPAVAATMGGYQGLSSLMAPSDDLQSRVGAVHALPAGFTPPAVQAPVAPQPNATAAPGPKPVVPGSGDFKVPGVGMPGYDWKGAQQKIDAATGEQRQGLQQAGNVEGQQAKILADSQAEAAKQQMQFAQTQQQAQDAAYDQVKREQADIQKNMTDLAQQKVDPAHWWNSRSTGQKAMAGLGIALSQMGSAFTHVPALDLVGKYIDQDIDAQKFNIENKRQNLTQRASLLEQNYRTFNSMQDAQKMTKLQMIDGLIKQGQAQAGQMQDKAVQGQTLQKLGALDQQNQQQQQQLWDQRHGQLVQDKGLQIQAANLGLEAKRLDIEQGKTNQALGQRSVQVGGASIPFTSDKDKEDFERQLQALKSVKEGVEKNTKTLGKMGAGDRARHFLNKATGGLVSDAASYGALNAAQEAVAVNSNAALGSTQAQTEKQYENMREGLNTPGSPGVGKAAGASIVQDAFGSAKAKLMASVLGMSPQLADRLLLQELGYGRAGDVGGDAKQAALDRARGK